MGYDGIMFNYVFIRNLQPQAVTVPYVNEFAGDVERPYGCKIACEHIGSLENVSFWGYVHEVIRSITSPSPVARCKGVGKAPTAKEMGLA